MKKLNLFFLILIFIISLFLHFYRLSYPPQVVFDEQWYASHSASYFVHRYYFDVHPPLAKLLIAFSGYIFGFKDPTGKYYFRHATEYPSLNSYLPLRILPAFLGSLIPILGWFLVKGLKGSDKAAFLASIFLLFDNALLTQSRFILIEIVVVFFSLLAVVFYFYFVKQKSFSKKWYLFLVLTGLSLGCAIASKWSAFIVFATLLFLEFLRFLKQKKPEEKIFPYFKKKRKEILILLIFILILPILVYIFSFYIHFSLIKIPRDIKDFSDPLLYSKKEDTTETPAGYLYQTPSENFFEKFLETNKKMTYVLAVMGEHPYRSNWYEWPFGRKPMLYYQEKEENVNIYLIPNFFVWCLGFFSSMSIFFFYFKKSQKKDLPYFFKNPEILYLYFSSWLFYAGIKRTSFLYYYLTPLCFSIVIFALFFDYIFKNTSRRKRILFFFIFVFFCFLNFLFFLPFVYGFSLPARGINLRFFIFPFWK